MLVKEGKEGVRLILLLFDQLEGFIKGFGGTIDTCMRICNEHILTPRCLCLWAASLER